MHEHDRLPEDVMVADSDCRECKFCFIIQFHIHGLWKSKEKSEPIYHDEGHVWQTNHP